MHGDLSSKGPSRKARKGAKRKAVTADSPPDAISKQVFFFGLAGLMSLPIAIILLFGLIEGGISVLLYILWAAAIPCMILAGWRGKFEIDAINHGTSAPRGKTFAFVGMVSGAGAVVANIVILIVIIVMTIFNGGGGDIAPETSGGDLGSPQSAIKFYYEAIKKNKFDDFKKCFSAKIAVPGENGLTQEDIDEQLKKMLNAEHKKWKSLVVASVSTKKTSDPNIARVVVSLNDKNGKHFRDKEHRMVREDEEWKVSK